MKTFLIFLSIALLLQLCICCISGIFSKKPNDFWDGFFNGLMWFDYIYPFNDDFDLDD